MAKTNNLEVWQRGSLPNVPPLLQPVAHALLQAKDEVEEVMTDFPSELLWLRPAGTASVGFHLQHLTGVLDRLFTYAQNQQLNEAQFRDLKHEGENTEQALTTEELVNKFGLQVIKAIEQIKQTDEISLTDNRSVGRAGLPSTVIGLLFHAAEHSMRHLGQLIVTVKIVREIQGKLN